MKRLSPAGWAWAFAVYAYVATVVCAAWFGRRMIPGLGLMDSLLWQALVWGGWIPVVAAVLALFRRLELRAVAFLPVLVLGAVAVSGHALFAGWIDARFSARSIDLAERFEGRLPVAILTYTALVAAGAAAHLQRRAAGLEQALAAAREALERGRAAAGEAPARLTVSAGSKRVLVDPADVECFTSAGNYVVVHWEGREGLIRETLQALERRLDPEVFARCHRSAVVNLGKVASAASLSDGSWRLTTASGADLVASRTYRDAILRRLGR